MLISSWKSKLSESRISNFFEDQSHPIIKFKSFQDSPILQIIDIFDSPTFIEKDWLKVAKIAETSGICNFLPVLHSIIINPRFLGLRQNALMVMSKLIARDWYNVGNFVDFYTSLLFDCQESEFKYLVIINATFYKYNENARIMLLEKGLMELMISTENLFISPLILAFSQNPPSIDANYMTHLILKIIQLIASSNIQVSSDAMDSLLWCMKWGVDFNMEVNIHEIQEDLITNLYSEDIRCITSSLALLRALHLSIGNHSKLLYVFVNSRISPIGAAAIQYIRESLSFEEIFQTYETKIVLLSLLNDHPFRIMYESVMTLPLFQLNGNEMKDVIELLFFFLNENEGEADSLRAILHLLHQIEQNDNSQNQEFDAVFKLIDEEGSIFEDLLWSENEEIHGLAQEVISSISILSPDG